MLIKTLPVGQLDTNCYVVTDENTLECAVIDPGAEAGTILDYIEAHGLKPRAIFITHGHFDHISALASVARQTGAPVYVHEAELHAEENPRSETKLRSLAGLRHYAEGDEISVGGLTFAVMETPGHSRGSVTLRCENALFSGDTLFSGSCGRTDLAGGNTELMLASLRRLSALDGDFEVYPGHDVSTTLEAERRFNYYVRYANEGFPAQDGS